jgi:HAUS augmin-like complex subunit 1
MFTDVIFTTEPYGSRWLKEFETTSTSDGRLSLEKRRANFLNRKAKEYETDLHSALANQQSVSVTVANILEQRERLRLKHRQVKMKRAKVKVFQGLPPVCLILLF